MARYGGSLGSKYEGSNSIKAPQNESPRFQKYEIKGYKPPVAEQTINYYTSGLGADASIEKMRTKGLSEETIREINKRRNLLENGGTSQQKEHNTGFSILDLIEDQEKEKRLRAANRES